MAICQCLGPLKVHVYNPGDVYFIQSAQGPDMIGTHAAPSDYSDLQSPALIWCHLEAALST
jgi:hypothetical protein